MGRLKQTYPGRPSFHFKKPGIKLFWILLIHIEIISNMLKRPDTAGFVHKAKGGTNLVPRRMR